MREFGAPAAALVRFSLRVLKGSAVIVAAMVALLQPNTATAAPLALDITAPDIASFGVSFNYDALTKSFEATGSVDMLDLGSSVLDVLNGEYSLTAELDPVTQTATGLLRITGQVDGLGLLAGTRLLEGRINNFGFDDSVPNWGGFQFVFDVTDGALSPLFGSQGGTNISPVQIQVEDTGFAPSGLGLGAIPSGWSFASSFSSLSLTTADTVAVPEPALLTLGALGVAGVLARRRRARGVASR